MADEEAIAILDDEFNGAIKIHHTNNSKLIKVEAHVNAERIQYAISYAPLPECFFRLWRHDLYVIAIHRCSTLRRIRLFRLPPMAM